jgi:tetratricopeptide (TPR) repeat protein
MNTQRPWLARSLPWGALLVLITLAAYWPAVRGGFIWDDDAYVTGNRLLTEPGGLARIWFSLDSPSQYFPLTYTSFWVERRLWGLHPVGYHLVNILLHAVNAAMLCLTLRRLAVPGAWLGAALFALHPVQVESVAWVTERKNVLSVFFCLAAMAFWERHLGTGDGRRGRRYWLAFGAFWLGLLSKTTAATLVVGLAAAAGLKEGRLYRRRWLDLLPFTLSGLGMGLVTIWWEKNRQGTWGPEFEFTLVERILISGRAFWFYVGKLVWPASLAFSYGRWDVRDGDWRWPLWTAGLLLLLFGLLLGRRKLGWGPLLALVFYLGTMAPLMGFFSLYTFRYAFVADHYQYLACAGPLAFLASVLMGGRGASRARWRVGTVLGALVLPILGALTWKQSLTYRDDETLWRHTLAKSPASWIAHNNLGLILDMKGESREASDHYLRSLSLYPPQPEANNNLGSLLLSEGRVEEAIEHYRTALGYNPYYRLAQDNLGLALARRGVMKDIVGAIKAIMGTKAVVASIMGSQGAKARGDLPPAAWEEPFLAISLYKRGIIAYAKGDFQAALDDYQAAVGIVPDWAEARLDLGLALEKVGRKAEALDQYRTALRLKPDYAAARQRLQQSSP